MGERRGPRLTRRELIRGTVGAAVLSAASRLELLGRAELRRRHPLGRYAAELLTGRLARPEPRFALATKEEVQLRVVI